MPGIAYCRLVCRAASRRREILAWLLLARKIGISRIADDELAPAVAAHGEGRFLRLSAHR